MVLRFGCFGLPVFVHAGDTRSGFRVRLGGRGRRPSLPVLLPAALTAPQDVFGQTPLHLLLARGGDVNCAKLLCDAGASVHEMDCEYRTPLDCARKNNEMKLAAQMGRYETASIAGALHRLLVG